MRIESNSYLCICIPTYEHSEKIKHLVEEILKCESEDFSIVVVDNNSSDDTYIQLKEIVDSRLKVYKNEITVSAKMNWYNVLEHGNGKYLCHLNDTDFIDINWLTYFIDIIKKREFDYGYHSFGFHSKELGYKKKLTEKIVYYEAGYDGMMGFGYLDIHPSGIIIKKEAWDNLSDKRKYFEDDLYGIYPHGFIFAEMAKIGKGIYFDIPLFYSIPYDTISKVYKKNNKKNFFWSPEENFRELTIIVPKIYEDKNIISYRQELILQRFKERLYFCTVLYAACESTRNIAMHYQFRPHHVFFIQQYKIGHKFCNVFKRYIMKEFKEIYDEKFLQAMRDIEKNNIKKIIQVKLRL